MRQSQLPRNYIISTTGGINTLSTFCLFFLFLLPLMINRKTRRNSPPPLHTTTAAVLDQKSTMDTNFAKWSRMLQLISPPNKKRRAVALIGKSCENSDEESDNEQETASTTTPRQESISKQKMLNRRAMYISKHTGTTALQNRNNDGPKDSWHKWTIYRVTHQKLRKHSLPLSESLHLRRMLVSLQQDESIHKHIQLQEQQQQYPQQPKMPANHGQKAYNDDEDDIPLGTLLENKKILLPATTTTTNSNAFYHRPIVTPPPPVALNLFYRQPCYYYKNMQSFPVQFI